MYSQHDGIAIGSPLEPTLSNTFKRFIKGKVILKYKLTYFRYVGEQHKNNFWHLCIENKTFTENYLKFHAFGSMKMRTNLIKSSAIAHIKFVQKNCLLMK